MTPPLTPSCTFCVDATSPERDVACARLPPAASSAAMALSSASLGGPATCVVDHEPCTPKGTYVGKRSLATGPSSNFLLSMMTISVPLPP